MIERKRKKHEDYYLTRLIRADFLEWGIFHRFAKFFPPIRAHERTKTREQRMKTGKARGKRGEGEREVAKIISNLND